MSWAEIAVLILCGIAWIFGGIRAIGHLKKQEKKSPALFLFKAYIFVAVPPLAAARSLWDVFSRMYPNYLHRTYEIPLDEARVLSISVFRSCAAWGVATIFWRIVRGEFAAFMGIVCTFFLSLVLFVAIGARIELELMDKHKRK